MQRVYTDGSCVEATVVSEGVVRKDGDRLYVLRDSKDPEGPKLFFTPAEWDAFVGGVKDGEFDDLG
nr:DUF397 domain-containing protein [Sphaerimonospora thailandensis]